MAAFLEGKLAPGEVAEVAAHLRDCAECRTVTGEAARFEQEEEALAAAAVARPRRFAGGRIWAAAAIAAVAATTPFLLRRPVPVAPLIDAAPSYRRVEGRLSRFPWKPFQGDRRAGATVPPAERKLAGTALGLLDRMENDDAVEARHAAGVAHLLIDQTPESLEKLRSAADDSKNAYVWNDLAVAQYTVAEREGREDLLPSALASVNRAIQLDPDFADAHFNRALILEKKKLPNAARAAWDRYLELDSSSEWANEARARRRKLGEPTSKLEFTKELERAAGDRARIAALVRSLPQDSRVNGEGPLLGTWAQAVLANDTASAAKHLALLRAIAEELAAFRNERLLLDAVHAIDRAADPKAIATAMTVYIQARKDWRARNIPAAEDGFRRAAAAFRAAGSPLAATADYYLAQCAFDRNDPAESTAALTALRARLTPSYHGLSAEIDRTLSRNANAAADWGTSARSAARAAATFASLGETANAGLTSAYEAFALEGMGAHDIAWRQRVGAIGLQHDPKNVATILHSAAVGLAASERTDEALACLDVATETTRDTELLVTILTDRARLAERAGDRAAARRWLAEARSLIPPLDPALRESREAIVALAEAVLRRSSDPHGAIAMLGQSIQFFESGHGVRLPDAYLQRARTWRLLGRTDAALDDYHAALREIRKQQENASQTSPQFLDVAAQTIEETIDLHLDCGEVNAAFDVTDRAHAMAAAGYRRVAVPAGTVVLEYAMLPDSLAIFCVTSNEIAVTRIPIPRAALAKQVTSFIRKVQMRQELTADARALHALLIAPFASRIDGASELVIVPDRQLSMLPFAALHDGKGYLIQTHTIRVAPSAAATPPTANRQPPTGPATIIADPATPRATRLQWSRREAETIAAAYRGTMIAGADATRARVIAAISSSALVHYAGHANSDLASYGALLLAPSANDSDLLTTSDIARLKLHARPLVVLSACGTMRGETTHVAGMPSLARAFLGAGARAVVGTLWEVDDDLASELFLEFHKRLGDGEVPAGALREAQLAMLQTSDLRRRHPSSWSAVEVLSNL
ncbi:MAG TPA: CHAT domain-containing protein [Thermoanaerobaculia bacterium]